MQKISTLGQKLWPTGREYTHTQTEKANTEDPFFRKFLAWRFLRCTILDVFFCFLKFWDLTYLWLFLDFSGVFCYIYPLLILKESVDRTKWHRDLKFGIWDLYIVINWSLKYFVNIQKTTSGFMGKT